MKKMKKLASILLAATMVIAMAVPTMATPTKYEGPYTITIFDTEKGGMLTGNEYEAFQIFSGDVAYEDGTAILANIAWGANVKALEATLNFGTAKEIAEKLAKNNYSGGAEKFARDISAFLTGEGTGGTASDDKYVITLKNAGYYLVKNKDAIAGGTAATDFILEVVGEAEATIKADVPSVDKTVTEVNDSTGNTSEGKVADYDIGDHVPFTLTGKLPGNYDSYETYKYVFHDTMSAGLSLDANSVQVFIDNEKIEEGFEVKSTGTCGCTFEVIFSNLKNQTNNSSSVINVKYTATLTGDSVVIGGDGNTNKVRLEYSNNPNPGGTGTGYTPEKKTTVFTFELKASKVTEASGSETKPLGGAGFTLYKYNEKNESFDEGKVLTGGNVFEFKGLDAGKYKLEESTVPAGYNKIDDIYFMITSELSGDDEEETQAIEGLFFTQTDDKWKPIDEAKKTFKPTVTIENGTGAADIVNNKGTVLPETGGIGTTIFYVLGAILVIGAGVLLVTKKRMSSK